MKGKISIKDFALMAGVALQTAYNLVWQEKVAASKNADGEWEVTEVSAKKYIEGRSK